ncbi:hypothetical protein M422DRAFT_259570 [Sphaerobolus stellatus SS14]|uniref:Uncharacterized protein n=1 Tax=Sphaerobolus stellatus (strain SS14) TaxID=990650 RepID=A0A0C9VJD7_SPHS4|nr:hypothetical protein M422DRAFT_259570 [Sphaerobolus stellatus SS14]
MPPSSPSQFYPDRAPPGGIALAGIANDAQDSVDHAAGHASCGTCGTAQELLFFVPRPSWHSLVREINRYLMLRRDTLLVTHGPPSTQGTKERYAVTASGAGSASSSSARR